MVKQARHLADRLRPDAERLARLVDGLDQLDARLASLETGGEASVKTRRDVYLHARWLARDIALANPLLDFDKLLFIKRHDPGGVFHMCDQYYGCNAVPGGGLFVLSDPFGPSPALTDLLANSVVDRGRLKGQKLEGGSFLSPELSYDGQTILFAYSQAEAWSKYQGEEAYEWTPECAYHIFKCNVEEAS